MLTTAKETIARDWAVPYQRQPRRREQAWSSTRALLSVAYIESAADARKNHSLHFYIRLSKKAKSHVHVHVHVRMRMCMRDAEGGCFCVRLVEPPFVSFAVNTERNY